jgi:hypothetical protein
MSERIPARSQVLLKRRNALSKASSSRITIPFIRFHPISWIERKVYKIYVMKPGKATIQFKLTAAVFLLQSRLLNFKTQALVSSGTSKTSVPSRETL